MFWNAVQWIFDRFIIGKHYWRRHPAELIVGFRVTKQEWEGKPNRAGWDCPKGPHQPIAYFLHISDAKKFEEQCRVCEQGRPVCFAIEPIQVRIPELKILTFWMRLRTNFAKIKEGPYRAYRRWRFYRRHRVSA